MLGLNQTRFGPIIWSVRKPVSGNMVVNRHTWQVKWPTWERSGLSQEQKATIEAWSYPNLLIHKVAMGLPPYIAYDRQTFTLQCKHITQVQISLQAAMLITTATAIYSLWHGLHTLTAVPRLTQPSTCRGTVKWPSTFGLSNNNKWRWRTCMVAAYQWTHRTGLAWFEGWQPPDTQSALFKWTRWTMAMASPWWKHRKHCLRYYYHYYYNLNVFFFSFHLVVACGKLDKSCSTCIRVIVTLDRWQVEMITTLRDSVKIAIPSWNSLVSLKISMCPTCMYLRLTTFVENKTTMLSSRSSVTMRLCSRHLTIENSHHGKSVLFTRCCSSLLLLPAGLWHF